MSNFLIGYFSRRQVFHIVAYRDSIEEVEAYLKTHNSNKLIVYASQHRVQADGAYCVCPQSLIPVVGNAPTECPYCHQPRR